MRRILMLNYEFPPLGGGGGVASYKLAKGFLEKGYEVDYVTSGFKNLPKFEVVDGINVHRVKTFNRKELATANMISMFSYLPTGFIKSAQLCLKYNYDFINTQFVIPTGPVGFGISKLFRKKNILSLHGGDIYDPSKKTSPHKHWYWRLMVKFILNTAEVVIAQSSNTKENAIKYYNPQKDIKIIPLPYEIIKFKKVSRKDLNLKAENIYLISIGRIIARKGYKYLIEALVKIQDPKVHSLIIGDGPEKQDLLALAKKLKVSDRLHILSGITDIQKFQYLSVSDIYVLSSLHEGFGIVLQEAMQVGLPIISTNMGGQVDLIKDNINGILVDPEDSKSLGNAIEKLVEDESARMKMKVNNLNLITSFRVHNIADRYLNSLL